MEEVFFKKGINSDIKDLPANNPSTFYVMEDTGKIQLGRNIWKTDKNFYYTKTYIDGYVEALPPRAAIGDCYVLKDYGFYDDSSFPITSYVWQGCYFLKRKARFENIFAGNNYENENLQLTSINTGLIPLPTTTKIIIHTSNYDNWVDGIIQFYDSSKQLISTINNAHLLKNYVYDVPNNCKYITIIVENDKINFLKIWYQNNNILYRSAKIYEFGRDGQWHIHPIPDAKVINIKGGVEELYKTPYNNNGTVYKKRLKCNIPKIHLINVKFDYNSWRMNQKIIIDNNEHELENFNYHVKLFIKKKRKNQPSSSSKISYSEINRSNLSGNKNNYLSLEFPYTVAKDLDSRRILDVLHTNKSTEGKYMLPYTYKELFDYIFTKIDDIIKNHDNSSIPLGSFAAATGCYKTTYKETGKVSSYADFAICLSRKIKGKWVDGEKTYFRILAKENEKIKFTELR